jgi:hypothetical protein
VCSHLRPGTGPGSRGERTPAGLPSQPSPAPFHFLPQAPPLPVAPPSCLACPAPLTPLPSFSSLHYPPPSCRLSRLCPSPRRSRPSPSQRPFPLQSPAPPKPFPFSVVPLPEPALHSYSSHPTTTHTHTEAGPTALLIVFLPGSEPFRLPTAHVVPSG